MIGPSHAGVLNKFLQSSRGFEHVSFTVFAIHGEAFRASDCVTVENDHIVFKDTWMDASLRKWYGSGSRRVIELNEYQAVLLLEPLFLGSSMRRLYESALVTCPLFLEGAETIFGRAQVNEALKRGLLISSSQWWEIRRASRPGSLNTLESLRSISPEIPILLVPPVNPPARQNPGIYSYYVRAAQDFVGRVLERTYGARFALQPLSTLDEKLRTVDAYHEAAPDPHHPTLAYYDVVMRQIDFTKMRWKPEAPVSAAVPNPSKRKYWPQWGARTSGR